MATLTTIKRQNIYKQVIEHLKQYIVENSLQPGTRLPTETVLAEKLGVSRLSVREALKVMESMGILETRPRDGTRLKAFTMKPLTDHLQFWLDNDGITIREMAVARQALECGMMPMVVECADESDFRRMEETIHRMRERTKSGNMITEVDREFHLALATATKNRAIQGFGLMLQEFFRHLRDQAPAFSEAQWISIEDHEQILAALKHKDVAAAQAVMKRHLKVYETFGATADLAVAKARFPADA